MSYSSEFADFGGLAYLNCAYQGPFPKVTSEAVREAIALKERPDRISEDMYFTLPAEVREELAGLLGAPAGWFALTNGASDGIFAVARGLDWQPGDQVLGIEGDFPCNFYTWANLDVEFITVPEDRLLDHLTPRTRVLSASWISYNTGSRLDLAKIGQACRDNGTIFVADLSQGAGALDLRLEDLPVDVAVGAGYKWLLSPYGTGFAYFRPEIIERLRVTDVYWEAVEGAEDFNRLPRKNWRLLPDARRFDSVETANFLNLYAMRASLRFLRRVGPAAVERHVAGLFQGLGVRNHGSTILALETENPRDAHRRCLAAGVIVSLREDRIRVSPHLYNSEADIERLAAALRV